MSDTDPAKRHLGVLKRGFAWLKHHSRHFKFAAIGIILLGIAAMALIRLVATYGSFGIVLAMMFVVGFGLVPFVAYLASGALPPIVAEPIANALATVGFAAWGPADLNLRDNDEYELVEQSARDFEKFRARVGMTSVGLTYDADENAFVDETLEETHIQRMRDDELEGEYHIQNDRDGKDSWVDMDADPSDVHVRIPEIAEPLRDAAGARVALTQIMSTLAEETPDQSGWSPVKFSLMTLLFALVGFGMGYVILV